MLLIDDLIDTVSLSQMKSRPIVEQHFRILIEFEIFDMRLDLTADCYN